MPEPLTTTNYDANNRQLTFGNKTLVYDDNGNLQSITDSNGTTLYSWNARNQLVGVNGPNVIASFAYDGAGRRQRRTINGSSTEILYDRPNPVQELSGGTILANLLTGLQVDEYFRRSDVAVGTTNDIIFDGLHSVIALTDPIGVVQTEYSYEPFGKSSFAGVSNTNPYQYTGRENDATVDLYYYRARYFHPTLQRFITEDPLEFAGGDTNLYGYVLNNPVNIIDPTGEIFNWLNCLRCNSVADDIHRAEEACKDELAKCTTPEQLLRFLDRYNGAWVSEAMFNCVKGKAAPDVWKKFMSDCFKCGILQPLPGPRVLPRR